MRKVILNSRADHPDYEWSQWRTVWLVGEYENTWRIWSWREPFTRIVHKRAAGERIQAL